MTGPMTSVLDALQQGARSIPEIARQTGLRRDLVDAVVEHLVNTGRLKAEPLMSGCPDGVCSGCVLSSRGCHGAVTKTAPFRARTLTVVRS